MKLLWLYLGAFLCLPIFGELGIYSFGITIEPGTVDIQLIISNIIFILIFMMSAYFTLVFRSKHIVTNHYNCYSYTNNIMNNSILLLVLINIFVFIFSGYDFLFNHIQRGQIRIHLGVVGPIYTVLISYVPVAIVIYISIIYKNTIKKEKLRRKIIFIYGLIFLLGVFTGYKSTSLTLLIPGIIVLYLNDFNIKKMLIFIILSFFILALLTSLVRDMPVDKAFYFVLYRLTTMTAYGTVGVWNEFNSHVSINDFMIYISHILGNKLSSSVLNLPTDSVEFLKSQLSRLVTYLVYPNTQGALNDSVNVTVTNFGDSIYLLGKKLFIFYALIVGILTGYIIRNFKRNIIQNHPLKASLFGAYFFSAILPSINSAGLTILISLVTFTNIIIVYTLLYFLKYRFRFKRKI